MSKSINKGPMSSIQRSSSATDSIYCGACSQPDDMNDMKRCCKCKITIHNNCIIKFIGDHSELKDREQWLCHACSVPIKEVTDCCACFATCSRLYKVPVSNTSAWVHLACQFARPLKTQKQKKKEKECCICKEGNLRLMDFPNDVHICHITCAIEKGYSIAIKTLKQENSNTIVNVLIILGTSTSVSKQQYFSESSTASTSSAPTFTRPLTPNSRSTGIGKTSAPKTGGSHAKAPSTAKLSSSSLSSSLPSLINGSTKTISNQSSSAKPTLVPTHMKTTGTTPETTITSSSHATSLSFPTPSATAHPSTAVLATKPTSDNRPAETADDKNNDEDKSSVPATQGTGIAWSALLPHSCNFNLTLSDQTRHVGITAWSTDNSFLNMLPSTVDISKIVQFHTYLKHEEAIKSRIRNEATAVCVLSDDDNNVSDGLTKKLSSDYAFATGPCNETFDLAFTSQLSAMGDWLLESMSPSVNASFAAAASNGQPLFILSACRKAPVNSVSSSSFAPAPTPQISSQSQDPVRKRKIARLLLLDDDDDG